MKSDQNKHWLNNNVNQILEPMMLAVVQENPNDKVSVPLELDLGNYTFIFNNGAERAEL